MAYSINRKRIRKSGSELVAVLMSKQATSVAGDIALFEAALNEVACVWRLGLTEVHGRRKVMRLLFERFDHDEVRAELETLKSGVVRRLNDEYYRSAALAGESEIRAAGDLYERWRGRSAV